MATAQVEKVDPPEPSVVIESATDAPQGDDVSRETSPADPPAADQAVEAEALKHGWRPREEYTGPADKWKPPGEFLEWRNNALSVWQRENKAQQQQIEQMRRQLADLQAEREQNNVRAEQIRLDGLKYERGQALEQNDLRRVNEIDTELLQTSAAAEVRKQQPPPQNNQGVEIWNGYAARPGNEWMNTDKSLQRTMIAQMKAIRDVDPAIDPISLLDEARDLVERLFPEKFDRRARAPMRSGMAEMGGANGSARPNVKTWSDLVPEARAQFDRMLENNPKMTKAGILKHCAAQPELYFRR